MEFVIDNSEAAESILAKRSREAAESVWQNQPETISAAAVAEKPQPHHRVGANLVDGL